MLVRLTLMPGIREASGKGEKMDGELWSHKAMGVGKGPGCVPTFPLGSGSVTAFMYRLGIQALLPQEMSL